MLDRLYIHKTHSVRMPNTARHTRQTRIYLSKVYEYKKTTFSFLPFYCVVLWLKTLTFEDLVKTICETRSMG